MVDGHVTKVYKGHDEHVRSIEVKTKDGTYDRPITKVTMLLSKQEYSDGNDNAVSSPGGVL